MTATATMQNLLGGAPAPLRHTCPYTCPRHGHGSYGAKLTPFQAVVRNSPGPGAPAGFNFHNCCRNDPQ